LFVLRGNTSRNLQSAIRNPHLPRRLIVAVLLLVVSGCATRADHVPELTAVARIGDYKPHWQPLFKGIDYAEARKMPGDPQAVYAVRIDLSEPTIEFLVTPSNGDRPLETDGLRTSTFLKQYQCQLAINASPFAPVEEGEGGPEDILGLSVSRGDVYSGAHGGHAAMLITKDNKVTFAEPPFDLNNVYNAVSGFLMLLENGQNVGSDEARHPRTAAGVSRDGRYLYLLIIDGRQPDYSVGATTRETAEWMRQLGAHNALNLDGGGSTTLVINDGQGGAKILNRPIHNNVPGAERVNGNHLGIFAQPLKRR
jgi:hypothetical protein